MYFLVEHQKIWKYRGLFGSRYLAGPLDSFWDLTLEKRKAVIVLIFFPHCAHSWPGLFTLVLSVLHIFYRHFYANFLHFYAFLCQFFKAESTLVLILTLFACLSTFPITKYTFPVANKR